MFAIPTTLPSGFDGVANANHIAARIARLGHRTCAAFAGPVHRTTELRGLGAAARRCGVSHTHIRKVLQGERKPSADLERKMRRLGLVPGEMAKEGK